MAHVRVHCIAHGRVQGVAFRANTQYQARRLGLTGWVRNCADGTVELLAEGEPSMVQQLVTWCQAGPPGAYVTHLEVYWETSGEPLEPFAIRY
jgi:acylphosphatase